MASLYSLFGKTQNQRIQDEDVAQATMLADELLTNSSKRMRPLESDLTRAELRFEDANAAWILAGKPFKGKVYKELTAATADVMRARDEYGYWNSIHLDHAERRMNLNGYL
ncbi:hypothetical protein SEA_LOZINAK_151 [Gordonia phage Lozinak]|uniref:Uncharacterized protein n=3 Tax=Smoothievirus TaxID=1982557 RepID=A0A2D1GG80_9CAUD|nr:hypothetical protein BH768_gp055 [Gordonia phage ClubL]YP_009276265.1 hypothetical protein BH772_gp057 [Gordonia phage Bachita]YP_009281304.1 hypothetical protein BIZ74_gp055 [Gordonia phage Cucurbita]ATN90777.1 hypothetical protein SEA_LOZINAK_151 [Gordonia phage Lozinak]AUE23657.1 hypothetical protein SEA_TONIANN_151 [Gordonia phage Toniann]QKY79727.1 hypothetical protein SEA_ENGINEER_153 [Gordonia Phage Engineer]WKW85947.1 hypothetical protein SEA_PHINKBODEN_149 [Gordonia Phage PhinkBod